MVRNLKQPYTLDGIDLERKDETLVFTFADKGHKEIYCQGELIGEIDGDTFETTVPFEKIPCYFEAVINGKKSGIFTERVLPLDGALNFRDLGGYKTKDGRTVKWGKLYRSDHLPKLSERDVALLERVGLRTIIDFRSAHERSVYPNKEINTVKYILDCNPNSHLSEVAGKAGSLGEENRKLVRDLETGVVPKEDANGSGITSIRSYQQFILNENSHKAFGKMMQAVLNEDYAPLVFHCRGGKDRTGFGAMLILRLLGVDDQTIMDDYLMTMILRKERTEFKRKQYEALTDNPDYLGYLMSLIDARKEYMEAAYKEIEKKYGTTENFVLQAYGVTEKDIEKLKEMYLI